MRRKLLWLVFGVLPVCVFETRFFNARTQVGEHTKSLEIDTSHFPIADLVSAEPSDPVAREKRAAKAKKHNSKYAPKITEAMDGIYLVNNTLTSLPALPVGKSSAVVIAEITSATAYLSEDQSSLYSEFGLRIKRLFKNGTANDLTANTSIEAERIGGRVRLPSGKIIVSSVDNQDMPRLGRTYLLFLTGGEPDQDFSILTGYELRDGKVFPLDKTGPSNPISAFKGRDEAALIWDVILVTDPRKR
jgi:hypothetical protein